MKKIVVIGCGILATGLAIGLMVVDYRMKHRRYVRANFDLKKEEK